MTIYFIVTGNMNLRALGTTIKSGVLYSNNTFGMTPGELQSHGEFRSSIRNGWIHVLDALNEKDQRVLRRYGVLDDAMIEAGIKDPPIVKSPPKKKTNRIKIPAPSATSQDTIAAGLKENAPYLESVGKPIPDKPITKSEVPSEVPAVLFQEPSDIPEIGGVILSDGDVDEVGDVTPINMVDDGYNSMPARALKAHVIDIGLFTVEEVKALRSRDNIIAEIVRLKAVSEVEPDSEIEAAELEDEAETIG